MNIKAVLFDMDGLMFDTENLWIKACVEIAKTENIGNITAEFVKSCIGANQSVIDKKFASTILGNVPLDKYRQAQYDYINSYCQNNGTPVKPGLQELISYLKKQNIKIALVSGSKKHSIMHYIKCCKFLSSSDFNIILSCDDIKQSKPNPEGFLTACNCLNVLPSECMVLEDSLRGVEAGFNAGCITVMVPDLIQPTLQAKKQANYICKDLYQVNDLIANSLI